MELSITAFPSNGEFNMIELRLSHIINRIDLSMIDLIDLSMNGFENMNSYKI